MISHVLEESHLGHTLPSDTISHTNQPMDTQHILLNSGQWNTHDWSHYTLTFTFINFHLLISLHEWFYITELQPQSQDAYTESHIQFKHDLGPDSHIDLSLLSCNHNHKTSVMKIVPGQILQRGTSNKDVKEVVISNLKLSSCICFFITTFPCMMSFLSIFNFLWYVKVNF